MSYIIQQIFTLLLTLILAPIGLLVFIVLYFNPTNPIFFLQIRVGKDQKSFKIIKFRTMLDKRDDKGILLPDNQRITKIGSLLRKYSLDELPQIIHVLKGEMNLVGPRPLPPTYLPLYSSTQARRHEVKPGITGWAQVKGRNALTWQQKFEMDVWYVDNRSFWLDIKILWLTFLKIFYKNDGNIFAEPFKGNN